MQPIPKRLKIIALFLLLSTAIAACKDDSIRKAARASDDMATIVSLAIDAKRGLAQTTPPLITSQEELALTFGLQKVNAAVQAFHSQALATRDLNPATKAQLLSMLSSITQSVNELNQQDVFGIRNPDAKAKLTAVLSGFSGAFIAIQAALGS